MSEWILPFAHVRDGVTIAVCVSSNGERQLMEKIADEENDTVIRFLRKAWQVPKTSLPIATGAANRRKMFHMASDNEDLFLRVRVRMESHDG